MDPPKREAKPTRRKGPSAQERRREEVLRAQKESRRSALYRARDLIEDADQGEDLGGEDTEVPGLPLQFGGEGVKGGQGGKGVGGEGSGAKGWRQAKRSDRVRERRIFWASSVTTPEWMVSRQLQARSLIF
jgi:hypothetical protein